MLFNYLKLNLYRIVGFNFTALLWCVYFILAMILAAQMVSGDSDLVLHICYGDNIIYNGRLPAVDPFLYRPSEAVVLQEWSFEILVAILYNFLKLGGPLLFGATLLGTLISWLFYRMRLSGVSLWVAMAYANFIFVALKPHLTIRPHMITWLVAALLWSLLESWEEKKRTLLSTIIFGCIIMLCWANIHGGFLLGFAISVIFLMGEILNMVILQKKTYPMQACIILIAFILATTINPWGVYLHKHLISFLNNEFLISGTSDFQPPVFSDRTIYALIILLCIVWVPLLLQWRKVKLHEWLLVVCLSIASAKWTRNIPFLGILACPIAAKYLQTFFSSSSNHNIKLLLLSSKRLSQEEKGTGWFWGTSIFLLATFFIGSGLFSISLSGKLVPIKGLDWVKKHSEYYQQPVLADYLYAGYLLYETPVKKVFLHALNANYSEVRLLTWIAIANGTIGWEKRLEDIKWAFLKRGSPQMASFLKSSYWRPIYEDNMVVVFNRF